MLWAPSAPLCSSLLYDFRFCASVGCYVDQVGNGEKRNCGDPTHNHTIHGGSFWAEGFYSILAEVRASAKKSSMFMTEGIAEEVSGTGFDILLGLEWDSSSGTASSTKLPYW